MLMLLIEYIKVTFSSIYNTVTELLIMLIRIDKWFTEIIIPIWTRDERIPIIKMIIVWFGIVIAYTVIIRAAVYARTFSYKKWLISLNGFGLITIAILIWSGLNSVMLTLIVSLFSIFFSFIGGKSSMWYKTLKASYNWWSVLIFLSSITCLIDLWIQKSHYIFIKLEWDFLFFGNYNILVDFVSIHFVILTTFLIPVCMFISLPRIKTREYKKFIVLLVITEFMLINVFLTNDILFFYVWFEGVAIPVFILIGIYGSRSRKIHASYMFWFYTLGGSLLMLLAIITIYKDSGSTFIQQIIEESNYNWSKENFLFWCFFISIMVKTPMLPFHIWLPEAHVEAPTAGSVLLAGVLLKLGTYGAIRFVIPLFYNSVMYYRPLILTIALISIVYSSLSTIRQIDLKKIIAYSSVAHMNVVILGLFSGFESGYQGSIFLMVAHGIVSSALFICIGALYDRYKTKNLMYYSGLVIHMPLFTTIFFLLTLANSGFPLFCNFIGELTCLISCFKYSTFAALIGSTGMIFGAIYSFWLFNRICFRQHNSLNLGYYNKIGDLNQKELILLILFVMVAFILGVCPSLILDNIYNYSILN